MKFKSLAAAAVAGVLASTAAGGVAGAVVITNGVISVGVSEYGQLYDASGVGLKRNGDGVDVVANGYARESWGLNGDYADDGFYGLSGVVAGAMGSTANSAVARVTTLGGFEVTQTFSFVGANVLAIGVDLSNVSGADLTAVFQRLVDFQVDGSGEYAGNPYSTGLQTTIAGYDYASTTDEWLYPCCGVGGEDYGAGFRFDLGTIAAGGSRGFTFYYGLGGADVADQLNAAGAKDVLTVTGGRGAPAAALGVSAVPEPSTWAMTILGFFGLGARLRRRPVARA